MIGFMQRCSPRCFLEKTSNTKEGIDTRKCACQNAIVPKKKKWEVVMNKLAVILVFAVVLLISASASAQTYQRIFVQEPYTVTVHPAPYWSGYGWVVPAPYAETRYRCVERLQEIHPVVVCPPQIVRPAPVVYPSPCYWYVW